MSESPAKAHRAVLEKALSGEISDRRELERAKLWACRRFDLSRVPSNAEILSMASEKERKETKQLLQKKPVRTISGVSIITVMPRPYPCPKDPCIYCPGGVESNTPQSYTGREPASARAIEANYDPTKQIRTRVKQLRVIGHEVDKIELIIFGGTFLAQPRGYQLQFVHSCLDAITGTKTPNLESAKKVAETADTRVIGITLETRPDYCKQEHIDQMLSLGGTRVEIGVQTVYDDIYELTNRGHTIQDVVEATKVAKDSGMAVLFHMMPGLPGSSPKRDLKALETIFEDPRFRPDMLKIYPCLVIEGTELYRWWRDGKFEPLGGEEASNLIAQAMEKLPRWTRIQRMQRDIPSDLIEAGVQKGNLREIVHRKLARKGKECKCIRCREVGHRMIQDGVDPREKNVKLLEEYYEASNGEEIFLSFEDVKRDIILGYLRLRIPSKNPQRREIDDQTSLVRMLYILGRLVPVGGEVREPSTWQHRNLGRRLLAKAERISREEYDMKKVAILSGIGSRPYYRKFGYQLEDPYMVKVLP